MCMYVCPNCKHDTLPFSALENDELVCTVQDISENSYELYNKCNTYNFEPFISVENENYFDNEIDPDKQFFDKVHLDCKYYSDKKFEHCVKNVDGISMIHFNCRSIRKSFDNIVDFLHDLPHDFDIIAFTENWENVNDCSDKYMLQGYKSFFISRTNKSGGGVAIFSKHNLQAKLFRKGSFTIDDVFDCVSVEIETKLKNIIKLFLL